MAIIGSAEIEIRPTTARGFEETAKRDIEDPLNRMGGRIKSEFADIGKTILGAVAVKEVGQFFAETVTAASDTVESVGKVGIVFGESADEVERFADGAEYLGLAEQAALEAAGTFGNLFRSLKIGQEQSADMSVSLVELAGDLSFFNNVPVDDALQALRSGLVGETEPLKVFGVNLNEATIRQEALNLGLDVGSGVLDAATKAQAAYSLILEQTALAQGNAVLTGHELSGQQKRLTAEWANAKAEIGGGLLPAALEMVAVTRGELVPTVVELAESAVPLLIAGFEAAEPLLGSTTTIIRAMAPGLEAVAAVIDSIPEPLLSVAVQGYAASRAFGAISTGVGTMTTRFSEFKRQNWAGDLSTSTQVAASGISKLNVAAAAVPIVITAGVAAYSAATAHAREYAQQVDEVAISLKAVLDGQADVNETLDEYIKNQDLSNKELAALDTILGEDAFGQIRDAIAGGRDELDPFREAVRDLGVDLKGFDFGELDSKGALTAGVTQDMAEAFGISAGALRDLIGETEDWREIQQDAAQEAIETKVRTGDLTQAQVDAAQATAGFTGENENWLSVASVLGGEVAELAGVTDDMGGAASDARPSVEALNDVLEVERERLADVNDELSDLIDAQLDAFGADLAFDEAVAKLSDSLADYEIAVAAAKAAAEGRGEADEAVIDSVIALGDAETTASRARTDALDRVREAEAAAADARTEYGAGSEAALAAEKDLADARQDLADTNIDTARDVTEAREGIADAEVAASEEGIEAGRRLRDMFFDLRGDALDLAKAAEAVAEAQATAAGGTFEWGEKNDTLRTQLQETLDSIAPDSPLRGELSGLIEDLDNIPNTYIATMVLEAQDALHDMAELNAGLIAYLNTIGGTLTLEGPHSAGATIGALGAAHGFSGTVSRPTMFMTGEGGAPEDVLVVPQSLGGVSRVVAELAQALGGGRGDVFGRRGGVHQTNHFNIVESRDGRSTALQVAKRLRAGSFRGGLSGIVD